jgi:hypothetical protein
MLQGSYNAGPTPPQIVLDNVPNPIGVQGSVVGDWLRLIDSGSVQRVRAGDGDPALLELVSTTQGFRPPVMTQAQRDAIGSPGAGLLVFNTDTNQLNQHDGSGWTVPGAGLTTLQGAYDNDPTGAQILLGS